MTDRKVKKLTPNSIANLVEPTEAWHDSLWVRAEDYDSLLADFEALRTALAAPKQEHPGYVIGSHWLETAYSRVCAGEAEADVLRDMGLVREEAFLLGVQHLREENERLRDELRQSSIDITRAEVERLRELLIEARGAKWLVVQNNLLDRIDAALRREEA